MKITALEAKNPRWATVAEGWLQERKHNAVDVMGAKTPARDVTPAMIADWLRILRVDGVRCGKP